MESTMEQKNCSVIIYKKSWNPFSSRIQTSHDFKKMLMFGKFPTVY